MYRILNCPCYDKDYEECLNTPRDTYENCENISDCLLKQIVEKCRENYISEDNVFDISRKVFTQQILDLLEIEEVNE